MTKELYIQNTTIRYLFYLLMSLSTTIEAKDEYALACLEQAIHEKIRKIDICSRYSSMQYLLILYEPDETQIPKVMDRIFQSCIQMIESFSHSC